MNHTTQTGSLALPRVLGREGASALLQGPNLTTRCLFRDFPEQPPLLIEGTPELSTAAGCTKGDSTALLAFQLAQTVSLSSEQD